MLVLVELDLGFVWLIIGSCLVFSLGFIWLPVGSHLSSIRVLGSFGFRCGFYLGFMCVIFWFYFGPMLGSTFYLGFIWALF